MHSSFQFSPAKSDLGVLVRLGGWLPEPKEERLWREVTPWTQSLPKVEGRRWGGRRHGYLSKRHATRCGLHTAHVQACGKCRRALDALGGSWVRVSPSLATSPAQGTHTRRTHIHTHTHTHTHTHSLTHSLSLSRARARAHTRSPPPPWRTPTNSRDCPSLPASPHRFMCRPLPSVAPHRSPRFPLAHMAQ